MQLNKKAPTRIVIYPIYIDIPRHHNNSSFDKTPKSIKFYKAKPSQTNQSISMNKRGNKSNPKRSKARNKFGGMGKKERTEQEG